VSKESLKNHGSEIAVDDQMRKQCLVLDALAIKGWGLRK
jgi:hypothetical protein